MDRGHHSAGLVTDRRSDRGYALLVLVDDPAPALCGHREESVTDLGMLHDALRGEAFQGAVEVAVHGVGPGKGQHGQT